jgi:hypothetical protein
VDTTPKIEYATVPLSALRTHSDNPRRGNLEAITASLKAHGQYRPLVVSRATMEVLCGNHVLLAARELGFSEFDAALIDVDAIRRDGSCSSTTARATWRPTTPRSSSTCSTRLTSSTAAATTTPLT